MSYSYNSANYVISDGKNKPSKDMIDTVSCGRSLFEGYKYVEEFILKYYRAPSISRTNERTIKNIFDYHNENDTSFQKRLKNSKKIVLNTVVIDRLIERITDDIVCDGDKDFEKNIDDDGD
jgi:hypothetical protein